MVGVILSEAKDLRGPSAFRPQGDRKGVVLRERKRPKDLIRPFAAPSGYRPQGYGSGRQKEKGLRAT